MKRLFIIFSSACLAAVSLAGCEGQHITYSGPSYVGFADTLSVYPVQQSGEPFGVDIAATQACGYDRTFGVEVITQASNASYGRHYTLESESVVIKAGECTARIYVKGIYDNIEASDSLGFALRLVSTEDVEWDLYGLETKVIMQKSCPFDIHDFTGYCLVTSSFLKKYGGSATKLAHCEMVEGEQNTILIKGLLYDGFDVKMKFDPSNLLNPAFRLAGRQAVADTRVPFGYIYGNGLILAEDAQGAPNIFSSCQKAAIQYLTLKIDGMTDEEFAEMGTNMVGTFVNVIEWISDDEAESYK